MTQRATQRATQTENIKQPGAAVEDEKGIEYYLLYKWPSLNPTRSDARSQAAVTDVLKYLIKEQVLQRFQTSLNTLLNSRYLPYNPYPVLIRMLDQQVSMDEKSYFHAEELAKSALMRNVKTTNIDYVCSDQSGSIWGLSTIIRCVDAGYLKAQFDLLLADMTPRIDSDVDIQQFKSEYRLGMQTFVSLIGEPVFYKTFYERYNLVQIRVEHLITGDNLITAVDLFVRVVLRDLSYHHRLSQHVLIGVHIPELVSQQQQQQQQNRQGQQQQPLTSPNRAYQFWTVNEVNANSEAFVKLVTNSVHQGGSYIYGQFLVKRLDAEVYVRVEKQYGMHFLGASQNLQEQESLLSFVNAPFSTLYEGVFFHREMAEAYCGMVTSRYEFVDSDKVSTLPLNQIQVAKPVRTPITKWEDRKAAIVAQQSDTKAGIKQPETVYNLENAAIRLRLNNEERMRVDGFRILQERNFAPDLPAFLDFLRTEWRYKCLRTAFINEQDVPASGGLFAIVQMMPLLISYVLSDRERYSVRYGTLLTEIMFILRSDAARIHELINNNLYIRELARAFSEKESRAAQLVYAQYKRALRQFFDEKVHQRPAQFNGIAQLIESEMTRLHQSSERDITMVDKLPLTVRSMMILKRINSYKICLLIQLVTVAISKCSAFLNFLGELGLGELAAGMVAPQLLTAVPQPQPADKKKTTAVEKVQHGYEFYRISDQAYYVIDVEAASQALVEQNNPFTASPHDTVYLKYVADTRIDQVWESYLLKIFTDMNSSVISPYTLFMNELWQACMKMHLFCETLEQFEERCLRDRVPKLLDIANELYGSPTGSAYGSEAAMRLVDPVVFHYLNQIVQNNMNDVYVERRGEFRIANCLAVSGTTLLYGRLDPFLDAIRVNEHIYIKGPVGGHLTAIAGFAEIVREHVLKWSTDFKQPVIGVMLGTDASFKNDPHRVQRSALWTVVDLQTKFISFEAEVQRVLAEKEAVFFICFVPQKWRYIPLIKRFHFHYVNFETNSFTTWSSSYILSMHFDAVAEREKAIFHLQQGGVTQFGLELGNAARLKESCEELDKNIWLAIRERFDWCEAYRYLMLKAVLLKNNQLLHDCWKFLHSVAAELDYANSLNKTLQMLILLNVAIRESNRNAQEQQPDVQRAQVNSDIASTLLVSATNYIDEGLVASTFKEFLNKVRELLNKPVTIIPDTLVQYVLGRLSSVTEQVKVQGRANEVRTVVRISTDAIIVLEDVYELITAILQQLVYNINEVLPEAKSHISVILREMDSRYQHQRRRPDDIRLERNDPAKMRETDPHAVLQLSAFRIIDDPKIGEMENMRSYILTKPDLVICDHLNEWWLHQI